MLGPHRITTYTTALLAFLSSVVCDSQSFYDLMGRQTNWTIGQTVQTTSGPVQGQAAKNATSVSEYLGIPYAQPPVGRLRFQPPLRFSGSTTINGSNFGNVCHQPDFFSGLARRDYEITAAGQRLLLEYYAVNPPQSEDCLTLNVWTKPQAGEAKKAVMVSSIRNIQKEHTNV